MLACTEGTPSGDGGEHDKGEGGDRDSHNGLAEIVLCPMVGIV